MPESHSSSPFAKAGGRLLRSRRLVRLPIWIYKAGAGALFGSRILMMEHVGRVLAAYRNRHPGAWERFPPLLEDTLGQRITDTDTPLPMVELRLD